MKTILFILALFISVNIFSQNSVKVNPYVELGSYNSMNISGMYFGIGNQLTYKGIALRSYVSSVKIINPNFFPKQTNFTLNFEGQYKNTTLVIEHFCKYNVLEEYNVQMSYTKIGIRLTLLNQ